MEDRFRVGPLSGEHDRSRFSSGSDALDRYFREQASQDVKRRITACFVAVGVEQASGGTKEVAGFYTLAAGGVALSAMAPEVTKKLPRYPVIPAALLGRLAVATGYQGKGLGGVLLIDAVLRVARAELGVFAMMVDAKDEDAQRFYERYGFRLLAGEERRLCLPIAEAVRRLG